MAKNDIPSYDATAANNTDVQSVDISENCSPAGINNAIREVMADLKNVDTGAVALTSPQFATASMTGDLTLGDNDKAVFGAGSDLQIYHDGSASRIVDSGTGGLTLQADANVVIQNSAGTETKAEFTTDGAVNLYYNNLPKFATTSSGIDVTGGIVVDQESGGQGISLQRSSYDTMDIELSESGFRIRNETDGRTDLFIDGSGNVGINTTTPSVRLDAKSSGEAAIGIGSTNAGGAVLYLDGDSNGDYAGTDYSYIQHDANGRLNIVQNSPSGTNQLRLSTGNTERMRILSGGQICVNTTSASGTQLLQLKNANVQWQTGPNSTNGSFDVFTGGNGVYLSSGSTGWSGVSDETVKDIIEPISDAVTKVDSLRAVIGKYKNDDSETRRSFLIAQDVEKVLPEAVDEGSDGKLGLRYTDIIPLLVAAMKEQKSTIEALQTRIAALEA